MSLLNQVNSDLEKFGIKQAELEKKCRFASGEKKAFKQKLMNITEYPGIEGGDTEKQEDSLSRRKTVSRKRDELK